MRRGIGLREWAGTAIPLFSFPLRLTRLVTFCPNTPDVRYLSPSPLLLHYIPRIWTEFLAPCSC
jgi:hypothetical protein